MPENDMLPPYSHRGTAPCMSRIGFLLVAERLRACRASAPCTPKKRLRHHEEAARTKGSHHARTLLGVNP